MTAQPFEPRRRNQLTPQPLRPDDRGDLFRLTGAIGPEAANHRDNVIRAQILLGQTGDLNLESLGGPTGWPGGELTRGLRRYQRRKGLTIDGLMLPDGETIRALQDDLFDSLADYRAPTTAEVDALHDRLARFRTGDGDETERPRMELERRASEGPAMTHTIAETSGRPRMEIQPLPVSDIDVDLPPGFTPGAQVAQAELLMQMIQTQAAANAAAAGAAGTSKQLPPGVTPEIDKIGRQLEVLEHVGGSHTPNEEHPDKEGKYRQELHFPNIVTGQQKGGSWADISFKLKEALAKELGIEYLHLSNAEMLKNDSKTAVSHERRKKTNLEANSPDSRVEYVEKPIPKRINGQKVPYDWESYRARVRDFAERLVDELEGLRKASSRAN